MLDPRLFTPLPVQQRRRIADDFIAFALARDGAPDVGRRSLAQREAFFAALAQQEAPRWDGPPIDAAEFARWHRGAGSLAGAPPLLAWLVKVARANEGEGWGVDYLLDRGGFDGLGRAGRLQPRDFADLEETYHTRIMRDVVGLFGITYELRTPPRVVQQSVKLMARLPRQASYMLLLAGELIATTGAATPVLENVALVGPNALVQVTVMVKLPLGTVNALVVALVEAAPLTVQLVPAGIVVPPLTV